MTPISIFGTVFIFLMAGVFIREVFRHVTRQLRCPVCGNRHPDRARRPAWAKSVQFLVPSQGFSCHACGNRFIRLGQTASKPVQSTREMH